MLPHRIQVLLDSPLRQMIKNENIFRPKIATKKLINAICDCWNAFFPLPILIFVPIFFCRHRFGVIALPGCLHNNTMFADTSIIPSTEPCLLCKCAKKNLVCVRRVCKDQVISCGGRASCDCASAQRYVIFYFDFSALSTAPWMYLSL